MPYDKMPEFIETVFNVFNMVNKKATEQNDQKFKIISLIIYKYVLKMAKDYNVSLKNFTIEENKSHINLIPFFEYISYNSIELYNFDKIDISDVDTTKSEDIERFVLSHVYYITQK